jgi:hypothetical protein
MTKSMFSKPNLPFPQAMLYNFNILQLYFIF